MKKHKPIQPPSMRHPSGRPVHQEKRGIVSQSRYTPDEPLTPGLRFEEGIEAIGFTANLVHDDSDDEEFDDTRETERRS